MRPAARAVVAAGAVTAAALFVGGKWATALELAAQTRGVPPEVLLEGLYPGAVEAARIVREAPGPVHTMPREHDPLAHQRLLEMVYPRRPRPYDVAALRAGDLVVLAAGRGDLGVPADEVFARGPLRIVRVR
jgi:hypothetical protein